MRLNLPFRFRQSSKIGAAPDDGQSPPAWEMSGRTEGGAKEHGRRASQHPRCGIFAWTDSAPRSAQPAVPIHHSPFTIHRFIPLPITLPYHAPVPPAGTPIMTVVVRGGTGPRHGANVARCRGRRTDRQGAGFHVRRGCGNANPAGNSGPGKGNALGRFRIAMAGAFGRLPCGPATGRIPGGPPETPDGRPQGRTVCLDERPNGRPSSHLVVGVL